MLLPAPADAGIHPRFTPRDLDAIGLTKRRRAAAVASKTLLRPRRGSFLSADAPRDVVHAVRCGGHVGCISALRLRGIFVLAHQDTHLHVPRSVSVVSDRQTLVLHRPRVLIRQPHPRATAVEVVDALVQSIDCQKPRAWIASVDSALHQGLIDSADLDLVFDASPRRYRRLRGLIDGRAESGPESIVRLMARSLGFSIELQVSFHGVGRVDLLLDGWLVVECDSKAFHESWMQQREDHRRDQVLAALGYAVYRPIAEDILYRPEAVLAALAGLKGMRNGPSAGRSARPSACPSS